MKQFFTLLLVILVSIPVNAQAINQNEQESENVRTTKFFSPMKFHNKKDKDYQTRNLIVKRKTESLKSLEKRYLDSLINQQWDDDFNIWRFSGKEEFTYENDKIKQTLLYIWDNNTSSWLPFQKDEYTFDTNGNLVTEIRSFQFTPNVWSLNKKTVYTYILTSTNHYDLSLEENFVWNSMASQWDSSYKYELNL